MLPAATPPTGVVSTKADVPFLQQFTDGLFTDVIGQSKVKGQLNFTLRDYIHTRQIPNTIFIAPRGQGKTLIATETAKGLYQFNDDGSVDLNPSKADPNILKPVRKKFVEINCSTLKNVKQFINGVVIPFVQDKDVTVFFDETSEIPHDIAMALLTILPVNRKTSTFAWDEFVCDFDFRRQSFLFATTESQKVFHALMDRLERVTLQDYNMSELAQILRKTLHNEVEVSDETLLEVATVLRGNARAAEKMSIKIKSFSREGAAKLGTFDLCDWSALCKRLGILPLGLNDIEVNILRYLASSATGTSLTRLSAKTGMSRDSLQKTEEIYLQKHDLMEISTGGRQITHKGLDYLKALDGTAIVSPSSTTSLVQSGAGGVAVASTALL